MTVEHAPELTPEQTDEDPEPSGELVDFLYDLSILLGTLWAEHGDAVQAQRYDDARRIKKLIDIRFEELVIGIEKLDANVCPQKLARIMDEHSTTGKL